MKNNVNLNSLMKQGEYAKLLRPLLPDEAFVPDLNKVFILGINVAILLLGWGTASYLDRWPWYFLWLFVPLALIMGNSIMALMFITHELMHCKTIKNRFLRQIVNQLGFMMTWLPPTFWNALHNRQHHQNTNSLKDPDRRYLFEQPNSWGKLVQEWFVPSSEIKTLSLVLGTCNVWGIYIFRNLISVILFNDELFGYGPAPFKVYPKERKVITIELLIIFSIHLSIIIFLQFHLVKLLLGYFLPIWIGYTGIMSYLYTHHMLCPMSETDDCLMTTLSVRVPRIVDYLHVNFSYHTEHHVFPTINSDYYPLVQQLLIEKFPEKLNLIPIQEAWRLMLQTPIHYKDETTFTDTLGTQLVTCPQLNYSTKIVENKKNSDNQ